MGLDMTLHASNEDLSSKSYDDWNDAIEEEIYWRKANAIHGWFVENVQDGEDDCGCYEVSYSQLLNLYDTLCDLTSDVEAKELLPPKPGFFFGTYDIDENYWYDVAYSKKHIGKFLNEYKPDSKVRFFYSSSW